MGTGAVAAPDRAKQRRASGHLWKKALLHFSLCFVMGFFTGFAPSSSTSSWKAATTHPPHRLAASRVAVDARASLLPPAAAADALSSSSVATVDVGDDDDEENAAAQRRLLIVVTTTRSGPGERRRRRGELLRLAHTLRLVRPPVVWVVVEPAADAPATAEVLRATGVMYRHLAFRPEDNFTAAAEAHAQRNAALAHVEKHRLAGVLHFADAAAVYDVGFFDQIRHIEDLLVHAMAVKLCLTLVWKEMAEPRTLARSESGGGGSCYHTSVEEQAKQVSDEGIFVFSDHQLSLEIFLMRGLEISQRAFGTWPVATMSAGEKKVTVEGPLCSASKVVGLFWRDFDDGTTRSVTYNTEADLNPAGTRAHTIDVSGFAFNSSILWDPERWGRPTSLPDTSQDSIKFVQEVVLEDRAKLRGIPSDCSQVMVWQYSGMSSSQQ